jgi:hypothetical protein
LKQLVGALSQQEQRIFFDGMLLDLVRKHLSGRSTGISSRDRASTDESIRGVAAMVAGLVQGNSNLEDHIEIWLTSTTGEYTNLGLDTRRAVIAALGHHSGR